VGKYPREGDEKTQLSLPSSNPKKQIVVREKESNIRDGLNCVTKKKKPFVVSAKIGE